MWFFDAANWTSRGPVTTHPTPPDRYSSDKFVNAVHIVLAVGVVNLCTEYFGAQPLTGEQDNNHSALTALLPNLTTGTI